MLPGDEPPPPSRSGAGTSPPGCATLRCSGGSPPPPAIPEPTGNLEVTVHSLAVCWETGPEWENSPDPPLVGATVSISGPGGPRTSPTDSNGKALFNGLTPGDYTVTAAKTEPAAGDPSVPGNPWEDVTSDVDPPAVAPANVVAGNTTHARRSLRRPGLECNRKHLAPPGAQGDGGSTIWLPIFWIPWSEPFWILFLLRDLVAWGGSATGIALGVGFGNLSLTAFASAFLGYMSNVIFGKIVGITLIATAFVVYLAAIVLALVPSIFPGVGADPWFFPMAGATWAGFLYAIACGRVDAYSNKDWRVPLISCVIGLLTAGFVGGVMGSSVGVGFGAAGLGALAAFVAGLLGHTFVNEGRADAEVWGPSDFRLPYDGDRYCVQGMRGWISHNGWQEFCYDWAMPEGRPILCAKEGHIIGYREDRDGTSAFSNNQIANEIKVRHRDGSVAAYLHLMQGGVTALNPTLRPLQDMLEVDPVHVHTGQRLGRAGNVGISMFPHLHFGVNHAPGQAGNPGDAEAGLPVKFSDGDAGRHGGICYSMRKYHSDNVDRGPVQVTAGAPGAPLPTGASLSPGITAPPGLLTPASPTPLEPPTPIPAAVLDAPVSPGSILV